MRNTCGGDQKAYCVIWSMAKSRVQVMDAAALRKSCNLGTPAGSASGMRQQIPWAILPLLSGEPVFGWVNRAPDGESDRLV